MIVRRAHPQEIADGKVCKNCRMRHPRSLVCYDLRVLVNDEETCAGYARPVADIEAENAKAQRENQGAEEVKP